MARTPSELAAAHSIYMQGFKQNRAPAELLSPLTPISDLEPTAKSLVKLAMPAARA